MKVIKILIHIILYFNILINKSFSASFQKPDFKILIKNNVIVPLANGMIYPSFELQNREILNLCGEWKVKKYKLNNKLSLSKRNKETILKLEKECENCHTEFFNDKDWETKFVPDVLNKYPDRSQIGAWYRKKIFIPEKYNSKILRLFILGANYTTDIWINSKWVGFHEGGYTSFCFDITPYIKFNSTNTIAIRVDNIPWLLNNEKDWNSNDHTIIPYKTVDWWNYGGINRDLYIEILEKVFVARSDIKTLAIKSNMAIVEISTIIENRSDENYKLETEIQIYKTLKEKFFNTKTSDIVDFENKTKFKGNNKSEIKIFKKDFEVWKTKLLLEDIKFWEPDNPEIYVLEVTLKSKNKIIDKFYTQFGVRKLNIVNAKLYLNNKKIFLNGIARHEEFGTDGRIMYYDISKKLVDDLKL